MTGPGPHGAGDLLSSFLLPGHRVRRELPEPQEAGSDLPDRAGLAAPAHPSAAEAGAAAAAEEWAAAEEAPAEAEAQDAAEDKV